MQGNTSIKRRPFWIGGLSGLLLLVVAGLLWIQQSDWTSPDRTLDAFCHALVSQDYTTAYAHLGRSYQQVFPYTTFAMNYRTNNGAGHITTCRGHLHDDGFFGSYGILDLTYANGTTGNQSFRLDTEYFFIWKLFPEAP